MVVREHWWPCLLYTSLDDIAARLQEGVPMEALAAGIKTYDYDYEAYSAVLGGFLGTYEVEVDDPEVEGGKRCLLYTSRCV